MVIQIDRGPVKGAAAGMVAVDGGAGPHGHLNAVSRGEGTAQVVADDVFVAVMERIHHFGVAAVASGGDNHALGRVDLYVRAIGIALYNDARHPAVGVLQQLFGRMLKQLVHVVFVGIFDPNRV